MSELTALCHFYWGGGCKRLPQGAVGAAAPRISVYLCCSLACEVSPLWTHQPLAVTRVSSITAAPPPHQERRVSLNARRPGSCSRKAGERSPMSCWRAPRSRARQSPRWEQEVEPGAPGANARNVFVFTLAEVQLGFHKQTGSTAGGLRNRPPPPSPHDAPLGR